MHTGSFIQSRLCVLRDKARRSFFSDGFVWNSTENLHVQYLNQRHMEAQHLIRLYGGPITKQDCNTAVYMSGSCFCSFHLELSFAATFPLKMGIALPYSQGDLSSSAKTFLKHHIDTTLEGQDAIGRLENIGNKYILSCHFL